MTDLLGRLLGDEEGQDLIEYALLTAAIGLAAVVVFDQIRNSIGNTASSWDTEVSNLWVPPDPGGGGS